MGELPVRLHLKCVIDRVAAVVANHDGSARRDQIGLLVGKKRVGTGVGKQVLATRTDIADLQGELPRQLALNVEVPLQNLRRQQVSGHGSFWVHPGLGWVGNCENYEDQLATPRVLTPYIRLRRGHRVGRGSLRVVEDVGELPIVEDAEAAANHSLAVAQKLLPEVRARMRSRSADPSPLCLPAA